MAKKRFKNVGKDIFQYGGWYCSAGGEHCADVIATALNELIEESKQLKEENEEFKEKIKKIEMELEELDGYKPYSIKRAKKPYICFNKED